MDTSISSLKHKRLATADQELATEIRKHVANIVNALKPVLKSVCAPVPVVLSKPREDWNLMDLKTLPRGLVLGPASEHEDEDTTLFLDEDGTFFTGKYVPSRHLPMHGKVLAYYIGLERFAKDQWAQLPLGVLIDRLIDAISSVEKTREQQLASILNRLEFLERL